VLNVAREREGTYSVASAQTGEDRGRSHGGRQHGEQAKNGHGGDDRPLPAVLISHRTERRCTDHHAHRARCQGKAEILRGEPPGARQRRDDEADDLHVEAVQQHDDEAGGQDAELAAAERTAVDELGDVERRGVHKLPGEGRSPRIIVCAP
jgi:hypothetical protein